MAKGVYKYLDVSTGHITADDDQFLTSNEDTGYTHDLIVVPREHGYFVHAIEGRINETLTESIKAVLNKAKDNDCEWVLLDMDGTEHDDLTTYEW